MSTFDQQLAELTSQAGGQVVELGKLRDRIGSYVQERMSILAPNVTALVGARVAAQLLACAGGLPGLAKLTSNALCALGTQQKRVALGGFSLGQVHRTGWIWQCPLIQSAAEDLRTTASRLVSSRCALAARIDLDRLSSGGSELDALTTQCAGAQWHDEIVGKLEKKAAPQQAKTVKPHKPPDQRKKRQTRGGRQARAYKKKFAMTKEKQLQNRIFFKS